ncbi:hypothetical protein [Butyrivibrio fibrisolvens]|uniref:HEPN domain-containing protein n=1 Tax=Butyrivibrio fibrisolvens TaxID=831 RepID=A0A317G7M6_BUTFI|nr:hypothetical protein [Butyrivibrio fibrisolvens]PWT28763.1 hypothetical protein CPT75_17430 [Butyrivibrio fibrisolvens]
MAKACKQEVFSQGMVENTAYLNWRTDHYNDIHNYTVLGDGFSKAAVILMDKILEDNTDKKGDVLIFPIFYDIDQAIEVYLKAILLVLNELIGNKKESFTDHDIKQLYCQMKSRIEKIEDSTKGLQSFLEPLSSYIYDLYSKIDYSEVGLKKTVHIDFARYPVTTAGTQHFYVKSYENEVVDIDNLRKRFSEVMNCLENLFCLYEDKLNNLKEMEAESKYYS